MRLKIDRETLLKGVGRTLGVVDRRGTMPILANFLLQTDENRVVISATDLEVSFRGFYPAEVQEHGALTVQAHYFFNLIKELPGETLDLTGTENSNLKIQVGDARYQLHGLPADQFPPVPEITDQELVQVESGMVKEMIEKTIFSVSADDLQYHLSSIFWERVGFPTGGAGGGTNPEEGASLDLDYWLRLISTDGHRLTLIERPLPGIGPVRHGERHPHPPERHGGSDPLPGRGRKGLPGPGQAEPGPESGRPLPLHPAAPGQEISRLPPHHPGELRLPLRHQPPASCSTPSGGLPCCPPSASKA